MLDGLIFEDTGKPAVVIATTRFVTLANTIKKGWNLPEFPLVVLPHPLGTAEEAANKAHEAAPQIIQILTR